MQLILQYTIIALMEKVVWDLKSNFEKFGKEKNVFDCMVAEFLLSDGRYIPTEEKALRDYKVTSLDEVSTLQRKKLEILPTLHKLFTEIEMPLVRILAQMELNGIQLDTTLLRSVGEEIEKAITVLDEKIKKEVGFDINLNSSVQVGNFLAEKAGVPLSKTKTGRYATNETEIAKFADHFPIVSDLLNYRELTKLRSTYVESLIDKVDEKKRVHTTYNQVAVSTGKIGRAHV